ncbi:hypothetical protein WLQ65_03965 [Pseudoalteromonas piscicida]|uniref:hypothetical protein n=1 Tax=Pseudoalteromonas piscicida TaxID=43662 RepID=UPI0030C9BAC0
MNAQTPSIKAKLDALGVKPSKLKKVNCPDCGTNNPDCLYTVKHYQFSIICDNCGYIATSSSFDGALTAFSVMASAVGEVDNSPFIDSL